MKPLFFLLAATTLLGLGMVWAQPGPNPFKGRVLLLANDRTLEGDIERIGEQYRIRRGNSEMMLPASQAQRLAVSWADLFQYLQSRANLNDPEERLRLARWAHLNSLLPQAVEQVEAALALRPNHAETKQLLTVYQRAKETAQERAQQPAPLPNPAKTDAVPYVDIHAEALALFATKVQPILLNTCVSCHSNGQGGEFQMQRPLDDGSHRVVQQRNLATVVRQLHLDRPQLSPLLIKSVSAHGGFAQPPLKGGRQSAPFHTLQEWVEMVVVNNPHLKPANQQPIQRATFETTSPRPIGAEPKDDFRPFRPESSPAGTVVSTNKEPNPFTAASNPLVLQTVPMPPAPPMPMADPFDAGDFNRKDPFDPEEFNRGEQSRKR